MFRVTGTRKFSKCNFSQLWAPQILGRRHKSKNIYQKLGKWHPNCLLGSVLLEVSEIIYFKIWVEPKGLLMFLCVLLLTWGWAWRAADSAVSAELSSTGTILDTPVELKVTHLAYKYIVDWTVDCDVSQNLKSSTKQALKTNLEVFHLLSEQHWWPTFCFLSLGLLLWRYGFGWFFGVLSCQRLQAENKKGSDS